MVILPGKFRDIPLQMLRADLVERPVMRSLEHRPEAFHPVRVGLAADIFGDGVIDRLMPVVSRQSLVCRRLVRVDGRAGLRVLADEALQSGTVHTPDDLGADFKRIVRRFAEDL